VSQTFKETHKENKNAYFEIRIQKNICEKILKEFGLNPKNSHIINGHVPVKVKKGESPVKADGKLLVIDGGFAKAYQTETGIAGYTLIYNAYGLILSAHQPFESTQKAIEEEQDIIPTRLEIEKSQGGIRIKDTDVGKIIDMQIEDLKILIEAYKQGLVKAPINKYKFH